MSVLETQVRPGSVSSRQRRTCIYIGHKENKGRHGTDPWSHQILPLLKLELSRKNRGRHDHGFVLQAEDYGKNCQSQCWKPIIRTGQCQDSLGQGMTCHHTDQAARNTADICVYPFSREGMDKLICADIIQEG